MARLFLAIDLPKEVKSGLSQQLEGIKKLYPQFSWVPEENYHITIYFFGQVDNEKQISEKIKSILFDQPKLYFYSLDIDLFMSQKIVIYLNFRREKNLEKLADLVKESFKTEEESQKKFVPHLTLAKTKIPSKQQYLALKKRLLRTKIDIEFAVDKLTLFESILSGKKPVYKKIAQYDLG